MSSLLNRAFKSGTTFLRVRCLNSHLLKIRCYTKPPDTHGAQHFKKPPLTSCKDSPDSHSQERDDHRTPRRARHKTQHPSENGAHERSKQESRGPHDGDQGPHDEGHQGPRDESHQGPRDEGHQGPCDEGHQGPPDKHHKDTSKQTHLYKILGIEPTASHAQIKSAYYKKSKIYHPDVNQTEEAAVKLKEVQDAYKVLSNPAQRKVYDRHIPYEFSRKQLTDDDFTDMDRYFIKTYITKHRPQYGRIEYYKFKERHATLQYQAMERNYKCHLIQMEFEREQRLREKAKKNNQYYTMTDFVDTALPPAQGAFILLFAVVIGMKLFVFIEEQTERRRKRQERRKARLAKSKNLQITANNK
ncbi:uncharacterized protein C2orf16 [Lingula anatina]|uniref:Uncharacterized protein C2orf16 n=1 Tax=Lingula anatina TaxID=7574 RepID=A0A1S3JP68_LINAN|nr:uncharacterized protein C2orf16 [Lingula anatina]|eukprot:XP_013412160.1 uncharacterized protein C2orf16 [Lingula anatina]